MHQAHELILLGGVLGLASVLAGLLSRRLGAPVLLVFIGVGMFAGDDGPGHIAFDDFSAAYLIGSVALAVILFEGGLKTHLAILRLAFWPALTLATVGVAMTAGLFAAGAMLLGVDDLAAALLAGAVVAPTDAAAVNALLRHARIALPERVQAVLEVESGLNDPMSVFLTVLLVGILAHTGTTTTGGAALLFVRQMGGGTLLGLAGGALLRLMLLRLRLELSIAMVAVLTGGLALFGLAQMLDTSGFLALYVAAIITGDTDHPARHDVERFMEGMASLAQVVLFLMLGLLVTPHNLGPFILPGLVGAVLLVVVARPVATFACLLPFGYGMREAAFASWVGLRGAVPIYLSIVVAIDGPSHDSRLFATVFVLVVASLAVQGWTIGVAARLLGFGVSK
jgi:cell volume regulation protein A